MPDIISKLGNSVIHHGKNSNRAYLMSLDASDLPNITRELDALAATNGYTKIVAKIPLKYQADFEKDGYVTEAIIPQFYDGKDDGCFVSKFLDEKRSIIAKKVAALCESNLAAAQAQSPQQQTISLPPDYTCRQARPSDSKEMAKVYRAVFATYPFPIHEEAYIEQTMQDNVIYYGIWHGEKLAGLSSIEQALRYKNAEMTDFAVLPTYRGHGFAAFLLAKMEQKLSEIGICTAYTIARAKSAGMNISFAKNGYTYAGTLVNNTDIAGEIESMNIWYKHIK